MRVTRFDLVFLVVMGFLLGLAVEGLAVALGTMPRTDPGSIALAGFSVGVIVVALIFSVWFFGKGEASPQVDE